MKLHFVNFDTLEEYDAESIDECRDKQARELWWQHEHFPREGWKLGCVLAERLDMRLIYRNPAREKYAKNS